jgi:hypothetical protein
MDPKVANGGRTSNADVRAPASSIALISRSMYGILKFYESAMGGNVFTWT